MFEKVKCILCIATLSRGGNPTALDIQNQHLLNTKQQALESNTSSAWRVN